VVVAGGAAVVGLGLAVFEELEQPAPTTHVAASSTTMDLNDTTPPSR
jgi:hypothetical protein